MWFRLSQVNSPDGLQMGFVLLAALSFHLHRDMPDAPKSRVMRSRTAAGTSSCFSHRDPLFNGNYNPCRFRPAMPQNLLSQ